MRTFIFLCFTIPFATHAAVVDLFDCTLRLENPNKGEPSYSTAWEMNIIRKEYLGAQDIWIGASDTQTITTVSSKPGRWSSHYTLSYLIRTVKEGGKLKAYQCDCNTYSFQWGTIGIGADCEIDPICSVKNKKNWYEIPIINATPQVSIKKLNFTEIWEGHRFTLACSHKETLN